MTVRYVGPGGNNGNSGLSWALRKLTLNGVEDTPVVAGDIVYVGPGVYREQLTADVAGGNTYTTGTVTVTNGSKTITGSGTSWSGSVGAGYFFKISYDISNTDGVTDGTSTFTSAAGKFESSLVGKIIQIMTKGAWKVDAVASATSMTLVDVNYGGSTFPTAGTALTYNIIDDQGPCEIESVDSNTQITLKEEWHGVSLTLGTAYITYNPIKYIADVTGEHTDGVGGTVRITGSDNDTTGTRTYCISNSVSYRYYKGFYGDIPTTAVFYVAGIHTTWEDCCVHQNGGINAFYLSASSASSCTIRRAFSLNSTADVVRVWSAAAYDNLRLIVDGLITIGIYASSVTVTNTGGNIIRNVITLGGAYSIYTGGQNVGQTTVVQNCYATGLYRAFIVALDGDMTEDYNTFNGNSTSRYGGTTANWAGDNDKTYPYLFEPPLRLKGLVFPWMPFAPSQWSQLKAIAGGAYESFYDWFGIPRPTTSAKKSWGAVQYQGKERSSTQAHAGTYSLKMPDAGRVQFKVPVTNVSTTISIYVYREADYAGTNPQMIIKQPGQADRVTTDAGSSGGWNQLTDTFTPAASPGYVIVELVSDNTASSGSYNTYFDDLTVT